MSEQLTNIYFVRGEGTGLVKIGHAVNVKRRLGTLQLGSPVKLILVAVLENVPVKQEKRIHQRFKALRVRGEWFKEKGSLSRFIEKPTPLDSEFDKYSLFFIISCIASIGYRHGTRNVERLLEKEGIGNDDTVFIASHEDCYIRACKFINEGVVRGKEIAFIIPVGDHYWIEKQPLLKKDVWYATLGLLSDQNLRQRIVHNDREGSEMAISELNRRILSRNAYGYSGTAELVRGRFTEYYTEKEARSEVQGSKRSG